MFGRSFKVQPNPETSPDSADPSGPCPRCGRVSNFRVLGSLPVTFEEGSYAFLPDGRQQPVHYEQVSALLCMGCHQATVVVEEEYLDDRPRREGLKSGGTVNYRGIHWWPLPAGAGLDPAIPKAIRDCFEEGLHCLAARAPRGAAVMFRRSIEAVIRDKGSAATIKKLDDVTLAAALREMADEKSLDPTLADWAKELRLGGNAGGHFDPMDDVTPEEAEELSKLLRAVLTYLYEMPAKLKRARNP